MDATLLTGDAFWRDPLPVAMAGPAVVPPDLGGVPGQVFFQTSGSTAAPKWIGLSREALQVSAAAVNDHLMVDADCCWGLALPPHHVGGFGVAARAREAGCALAHFNRGWEAAAFAGWLAETGVTHTSLVPTQVHDLVAAGLTAPPRLRAIVVGGGAMPVNTGQAARDLGWPVLASFGMTEAGSQIATQGVAALELPYQPAPLPLLDHWQVKVNEDDRLCLAGQALFSGVLVRQGGEWLYQQRGGDWFVTSDRVDLGGRLLTPRGRADLQVKVLGELVDLEAVEARLEQLSEGALPAGSWVVVAVADERAEHLLVPLCEARLARGLVEQVLAAYATEAPGYARLQPPRFLEAIPRSDLGKPLRVQCSAVLGHDSR